MQGKTGVYREEPKLCIAFCGGQGSGKCVCGNTQVLTEYGLQQINTATSLALVNKEYKLELPSHHFKFDSTERYKIKNSIGFELEGTPEHPILILDKDLEFRYIELGNLTDGQYCCVARNTLIGSNSPDNILYTYTPPLRSYGIPIQNTPQHMNEDVACLLGYIIANGCYSHAGALNMSSTNRIIYEECYRILSFLGHKPGKLRDNNTFSLGGRYLGRFLHFLMETKRLPTARFKTVPKIILKSLLYIQTKFIRGLFDCDAYFDLPNQIEYSSASKDLCSTVQLMLLNLGIVTTIHSKFVPEYNHTYYRLFIYSDNVDRYMYIIGSLKASPPKSDRIRNPNIDVIPYFRSVVGDRVRSLRERLKVSGNGMFKWYGRTHRFTLGRILKHKQSEITKAWLHKYINDIEKMPKTIGDELEEIKTVCRKFLRLPYFYSPVISTNRIESKCHVYDFTMPSSHSFITNGFISHNTTLADYIVEKYGFKYTYLNQTRKLINTMYKGDLELARKDNLEFQWSLINKKIYWERKHKQYGFVSDRTTLDNIAYFLTFSEHDVETREVWKYITKGVEHAKKTYDIIFCLSPLLDTPEDPLSPPSAINKYKVYFTVCGLLNLIEATHPHIVYYIHIRDLEGRKCLISNVIEEKLLPWISSPS